MGVLLVRYEYATSTSQSRRVADSKLQKLKPKPEEVRADVADWDKMNVRVLLPVECMISISDPLSQLELVRGIQQYRNGSLIF